MKVAALIEQLSALPQDAAVKVIWDGAARSDVQVVYVSRSGDVMLADHAEVVYHDEERPIDAPTVKQESYWKTPRPDRNENPTAGLPTP